MKKVKELLGNYLKIAKMGQKDTTRNKDDNDEQDKIKFEDYKAIEDVNMQNYEIDTRIKKKLMPYNDMWTFTNDISGLWNNNLFPNKEVAIQFGIVFCKQNNLDHFFVGKTVQPIDYVIDTQNILMNLRQNVLALTNYQGEYMEKVSEKSVYMLQDSFLEVLNEWLKENHLEARTFSILPETLEKYNIRGKKEPFSIS
ncbi:hypothetical protein ABD87_14900 [Lysinibacillus sphaericus]|uniref:hypothetical protein n=1 Tax=Lysinibacillus sphaericus TaxID=1421 RepID=UPI0018CF923A|nr:hypothetical protein [Lysinibacillus sphaericus]MBG9730782.1 hypothetical protein [Lysinibacillus sphaericus]